MKFKATGLTLALAAVVVTGRLIPQANAQSRGPSCQWALGINGNLCGFRPFSANSLWNTRADNMPTDPNSAAILASISRRGLLIDAEVPYVVVDSRTQPLVPVSVAVTGANDNCIGKVCYAPFPLNPAWTQKGQNPGALDFHGIVVDRAKGMAWEAEGLNFANGQWETQTLATWNLYGGDYQRPWLTPAGMGGGASWMGGLLTYDDAAADQVNHALIFTLSPQEFPNRNAPVWFTPPAMMPLKSDGTSVAYPVGTGTRFVLRADFDETGYGPTARAIIHALKKYGMILLLRGSDMYVTATGDSRWSSTEIRSLRKIMPSDFRVVLTQPRYTWHTKVWPN
jgi:hypothetical protein